MPLTSISAVYDGKEIHPLEPVPVTSPYFVVITFLSPASDNERIDRDRRFWESFGAWRDTRTTEEILADLHTGLSKSEPPSL
ncbi:MAG TPA: hypothetical protein VFD70_12425 [Anaerolineae bacterium]|nr:hypothetical protein [Anaerolineae bacterium]